MPPEHGLAILKELVVVFGAAVAVALLLGRLRLPGTAGLIVAGALIGPFGLGLVGATERIEILAEIGVVLLLFTIGLEFSVAELRRLGGLMLRLGAPQVIVTVLLVALAATAMGVSGRRAVFYGFLAALSSTAIVLQALAERGEMDAPHGRAAIGVLLFQDLCVVPMMLVLPMLAERGPGLADVPLALAKAGAMIGLALVVARVLVPPALQAVVRSRRRDLFVMAVLLVCAGVAWLTSLVGLSLALGAFLGGVVLADSEYAQQALSDVLPLRNVFASLFFISMGMLLDLSVLAEDAASLAGLVVAILAGKAAIVAVLALVVGMPARVAVLAGIALSQVGEFSFVLAEHGRVLGLLPPEEGRRFLAASVLTMLLTPLAIRASPRVAGLAARLGLVDRERAAPEDAPEPPAPGHVVVLGFGLGGQLLAEALRASGTPYAIVDIDADRVRAARGRGEPIWFGDATSTDVLERAHVSQASQVVLVLNDPTAALRAVQAVRRLSYEVLVTVRSRYLAEIPELEKAGATAVVAQEFEATMEIVARVLREASVPRNVIAERLRSVRAREPSPRPLSLPRRKLAEMGELAQLKIDSFLVQDGAWAAGRTVAGSELRRRTGVSIVAVGHRGETAVHPPATYQVSTGDVLYLVGEGPQLEAARDLLETGRMAS